MRHFELQGHRGARGLFAENTLEGFVAAAALGVSSLELDVAVTADGVVVVHHDPALHPDIARDDAGLWLAETAEHVLIRDCPQAKLQRYDVGRLRPGSALAALYPAQTPADGVRIPTLADLLRALPDSVLDVELKTDAARPEDSVAPEVMAHAVMAVVDAAGARARLVVRSFDWRGLQVMQRDFPNVKLAWLTTSQPDPQAALAASQGVGIWAPDWRDLRPEAITKAQSGGLRVVPWTVNDPQAMARLIAWGVDGICTDRPDLARGVMRRLGLDLPQPR